jgi:hypothetical protein
MQIFLFYPHSPTAFKDSTQLYEQICKYRIMTVSSKNIVSSSTVWEERRGTAYWHEMDTNCVTDSVYTHR